MSQPYLWVLGAHFVGIVFWMGGLFAALVAAGGVTPAMPDGNALGATLLRRMAHPGAALTILAGAILMGLDPAWLTAGWLHAKLGLVAILIALDLVVAFGLRRAARDAAKTFQPAAWRGAIVLLFLLIVFLATVKPF